MHFVFVVTPGDVITGIVLGFIVIGMGWLVLDSMFDKWKYNRSKRKKERHDKP